MASNLEMANVKCPHCKEMIRDQSLKQVYAGPGFYLIYHQPCATVLGAAPEKVKVDS